MYIYFKAWCMFFYWLKADKIYTHNTRTNRMQPGANECGRPPPPQPHPITHPHQNHTNKSRQQTLDLALIQMHRRSHSSLYQYPPPLPYFRAYFYFYGTGRLKFCSLIIANNYKTIYMYLIYTYM